MKLASLYKSHPLPTILSAFVLGILLASTVGFAIAQVANTTYYACVKTSTGTLRIVPASTTCNSNETLISWNQQGPQGIQGPQGPAGPPGPTGLPGTGGGLFSNKPFVTCYCDLSAYADQFQGKDWTNTQTFGIILKNVDIHGVNFTGSVLGVNFINDNLTGANFSSLHSLDGSNGSSIGASNSDLTNANVSNNSLTDGGFSGSNLTNADFSNDHFFRVEFSGANLTGTNFTNLTADRTVFRDANLQNTNFTNAVFGGNTTFEGAINMETDNFTGVDWGGAICPDGTNSFDHPDSNGNSTCIGYLTPIPTPTP